ncbi:MAG TPA: type I polyketide synthase, partial [Pilimelia sp.]|nr:type I polyketide synthase [Pilimelia sp.]
MTRTEEAEPEAYRVEPIAVIGMACRVPGAGDVGQFWENLVAGAESLTALDHEQMVRAGATAEELADPNLVASAFLLEDAQHFDAELFGMSSKEADLTDPQHRLFLELCHTALEDAGHDPARFDGDVGVYGGRGNERYRWEWLDRNRKVMSTTPLMLLGNGNLPDNITTLASYKLNLTGPSVGVFTACSTSLVAVHMACESLRAGECDMALAGGVSIELPIGRGHLYEEGGVESADGHVRPFDAAASGTMWSSGGGIVVLRRLADALADGDHIHAVVRGNAINNDGSGKVGFTAPSVNGQAAAISSALSVAGVDPGTVSYVEAHGTGTRLGDPIEIAALTSVYGPYIAEPGGCGIGSVKGNIGHLSHGAGVVGMIKVVLAMRHGLLPPSLNFDTPNPRIDFTNGPFRLVTSLSKWEPGDTPRRAGVSSFGVGGTNAHLIVEEAPGGAAPPVPRPETHLITLSARTPTALATAVDRLADHLTDHPDLDLADVAYTLRVGRTGRPHRMAVVTTGTTDAAAALRDAKRRLTGLAPDDEPRVAWLFPGQGAQYAGM